MSYTMFPTRRGKALPYAVLAIFTLAAIIPLEETDQGLRTALWPEPDCAGLAPEDAATAISDRLKAIACSPEDQLDAASAASRMARMFRP